jgi:hypothetical protein
MIKCQDCGGMLSPYAKKGHTYYSCTGKKGDRVTVREELITNEISEILKRIAFSEEDMQKAKEALVDIDQRINGERDHKIKQLRNKENKLTQSMDRVRELLIKGVLQEEEYLNERTKIQTDLQKTKIEMNALGNVDQKRADEIYDFLELSKNAPIYFEHGLAEEKSQLTSLVFLELKIKDKQLASYKLKPEFEILEKRLSVPHGGIHGTILELYYAVQSRVIAFVQNS